MKIRLIRHDDPDFTLWLADYEPPLDGPCGYGRSPEEACDTLGQALWGIIAALTAPGVKRSKHAEVLLSHLEAALKTFNEDRAAALETLP